MDFSTDIRAKEASDNNSRKKDAKQNAEKSLQSEEVRANLIRKIDDGGSLGRRLDRELRRTESTGRISNWLANQTTKAELSVGVQRQQAFDELVSSVSQAIESPVAAPFGGLTKSKPEIPSGVASVEKMAWDIYAVDSEGETFTLKVRGGTISGILPENWDDEFTASKDTLYYGIVTVKTDGQFINGAEINISTSLPQYSETTENSAPDEADFVFGLFKDGVNINTSGGRDISVRVQNVFATERTGGSFGTPAYNLWYRIQ